MSSPIIISIEGNIGVGKSTIIDNIELYLRNSNITDIVVLKEPIEEWTNMVDSVDDESILTKFYNNPEKFSFAFQVLILNTIQKQIDETIKLYPNCKVIICERSILSSREVFAKMLFHSSMMNEMEYKIYDSLFYNDRLIVPTRFVFMDVPPEVCLQRIIKRNRSGESKISLDYLSQCDQYHHRWLAQYDKSYVLNINCQTDITDDTNDTANKWIQQILSFSVKTY